MTTIDARYRALTQFALWMLFAAAAALLLPLAPVDVAFKLWSIASTGLSIGLLQHLPGEQAYRRLANGFGALLALSAALASFQLLDHPFLLAAALGVVVAIPLAARSPGLPRGVALASAAVGAAFGIAELIERSSLGGDEIVTEVVDRASSRRLAVGRFDVPDPVRGFAGRPDSIVRVRLRRAGGLVYDATYTLDRQGRRETPRRSPAPPNVVLFGDSFAFGEGVNDAETVPAQLERLTPEIRTMNFGFKAYGPHQALAAVEAGLPERELAAGAPAAAVYYAAFDLNRAAGRAFWDVAGPHYEIGSDGEPVFRGPFSADRRLRAIGLLNRSYLLREIIRTRLGGEDDVRLYVALIERTAHLFRERHGGPFLAVLWGERRYRSYADAAERLRARGIDVKTIQEIVPDFETLRPELELLDGHPSREGHARVAADLADRLRSGAR